MRYSRTLSAVAFLALWAVVLVLGLAAFVVYQNPTRLAHELTEYLSSQLNGTSVTAESVGLRLFPLPALNINGLVLRTSQETAKISVFMDTCEVYPALGSLLRGELKLSSVHLVRPSVLVTLEPKTPLTSQAQAEKKQKNLSEEAYTLLAGLTVSVEEATVSVRQKTPSGHAQNNGISIPQPARQSPARQSPVRQLLTLSGVSGSLRLPDTSPFQEQDLATATPGQLRVSVTHLEGSPETPIAIRMLQLELDDIRLRLPAVVSGQQPVGSPWTALYDKLEAHSVVTLSLDMPDVPNGTEGKKSSLPRFNCVFSLDKKVDQQLRFQGKADIRGNLDIRGYPTPVRLTLPFTTTPPEQGTEKTPYDSVKRPPYPTTEQEIATAGFTLPSLYFSGAALQLDKDKATLDGRLTFTAPVAETRNNASAASVFPRLEGVLTVQHLSLPRWFGFARQTPPGVQLALDTLSGKLAFTLSPAALDVYRIEADVLGTPFSGRGGVKNFARPVIELDVRTKQASLNTVFPELLGKTPTAPVFPMPPALDLDDSPPAPDDLKYDIRLSADQTSLWKWEGNGLTFRISPIPYTAQSATARPGLGERAGSPRLEASLRQFYGGTVKTRLVLEDGLTIALDVANVASEEPFARLTGSGTRSGGSSRIAGGSSRIAGGSSRIAGGSSRIAGGSSRIGGTLSSTVRLTGKGGKLLPFLAGLRGSADIRMENGFLTATRESGQSKRPFKSLRVQFQGEGYTVTPDARPATVPYTGQWLAELETPEYRGTARSTGSIRFSTSNWLPVQAESVPTRLSGSSSGLGIGADCALSFDLKAGNMALTGLQGYVSSTRSRSITTSAEGLSSAGQKHTFSGNLRASRLDVSPVWEGTLNLFSSDVRSLLADRGLSAVETLQPDALKTLRTSGDLYFSEQEFRFSGMRGQLDKTTFSGMLRRQPGTIPFWKADLELGTLDVDFYLPRSDKKTPKKPAAPWPVEQLHTCEFSGQLRVQELLIAKIPHVNVTLPLNLKSGILTLEPITAHVCGGTVKAAFRAEATPGGALTQLRYALTDADMLALTRARKQDTLISGKGTLSADIRALLRSSADIPGALNGTWGFRVNNGDLTPLKPSTPQSRSRFSSLSAFGTLSSGILSSRDLSLAGTGLAVRGHGSINLINWTLNYSLLASGAGIPDIPISYSGSLDDPRRSIDALRVIGSALGNVGTSILGIFEDVITAPMKIIGPPKGPRR